MISRSSEVILYPLTRDVASTDVRTKKRMPDKYICKVSFIFFMKIYLLARQRISITPLAGETINLKMLEDARNTLAVS